jgi:lipopolysaccharide biosynthesis protein
MPTAKKPAAKKPAAKKTSTTPRRRRRYIPRFPIRERQPTYCQLTVVHDTSIDVVIEKANEIFKARASRDIDYGFGLRGRTVEFVNGEYMMLIEEMLPIEAPEEPPS